MKSLPFILLLMVAPPLAAQGFVFDPDRCFTCKYSVQHFAAGGGINLGLQILPRSWKSGWADRPWKRVAVVTAVGAIYEFGEEAIAGDPNTHSADGRRLAGQAGYGFSIMDLGLDVAGALGGELLGALWRKIT